MHRGGDRLLAGDRVELQHLGVSGAVVEVLGRDLERVFRDGRLEVHHVRRYRVLLPCGRTVVTSDRGGRLRRIPTPLAPPPPAPHQLVLGRPATLRP